MSFVKWFARQTPQAGLIVLGLSCALITMEIQRLPAAHVVSFSMFAPVPYAVEAVCVALLCVLVHRRVSIPPRTALGALIAVALLAMASTWLLLWPQVSGDAALLLVRILYRASTGLLMVLWAVRIMALGSWRTACLIGASFLLSGAVTAAMAVLPSPLIDAVLVLLPTVAGWLLVLYRGAPGTAGTAGEAAFAGSPTGEGSPYKSANRPLPRFSLSTPLDKFIAIALVALPLICRSPMVSTQYSWMALQDGALLAIAMQCAIGAGTMLGALAVAFIVRFAWNRSFVLVLNLIVLPLTFVSFYTSQLAESLYFLHFLIVDSTYKVTLFYVMMTPFLFPSRHRAASPTPLYLAFAFMIAMRALFSGLKSLLPDEVYGLVGVVVVALSFVGVGVLTLVVVHQQLTRPAEGTAAAGAYPASQMKVLCDQLSARYDLTPREGEILLLLAQNYRAPYIAEKLVVSQSTVKTHMRNLYAKMGVHSQAELLLLVDQEANSLSATK